jgi:hypothetical protein
VSYIYICGVRTQVHRVKPNLVPRVYARSQVKCRFNPVNSIKTGTSCFWSQIWRKWTFPFITKILIWTSLDKNFITAWKSITKLVIFRSSVHEML